MKKTLLAILGLFVAMTSLFVSCSENEPVYYNVSVSNTEGGKAHFVGNYLGASMLVDEGESITVVAIPDEDYLFIGWYLGNSETLLSTELTYTTVVNKDFTLVAKFGKLQDISISCSPGGKVSFKDSAEETLHLLLGEEVTVVATIDEGYEFIGWLVGNSETAVSTDAEYTFTVSENIALFAKFREVVASSQYEAIDLGLPSGVKWASFNVGATKPEEYGGYYAWGETEEKENYSWGTYKWCNGYEYSFTKYCAYDDSDIDYTTIDNKTVLDPEDDVAHVKWGGDWRMPTKAEQDELCEECDWEWTTLNGVYGYKVTGSNGNSIFLPAAGERYETDTDYKGRYGYYWSSELSVDDSRFAYILKFRDDDWAWDDDVRYCGLPVRPVGNGSVAPTVSYTVSVSSDENGVVSIDGENIQSATVAAGATVTVSATANEGYEFIGWFVGNSGMAVSADAEYTFTVSENIALFAKFREVVASYTVSVSSDENGVVSIDGENIQSAAIANGATVTVSATANEGYIFNGWFKGDIKISSELTYSFIVNDDIALIAKFFNPNGREYVDLGLPSGTLWASCNVGATAPEKYGSYYSWGETKSFSGKYSYYNYGRDISGTQYDVAHVKWGGDWRMPTYEEQDELCEECDWEWTTLNGVYGFKVTGPNGNSIFLPAAGYQDYYEGAKSRGSYGYYWSSTLSGDDVAYDLYFHGPNYFGPEFYGMGAKGCEDGCSVRPVIK
ncbi:MAG: InlB B-repeat-containing protein [Bacteroidaceae bacterium]|nr:InlB B-repeat-containing protein [Bacteroidaceae bacterium]